MPRQLWSPGHLPSAALCLVQGQDDLHVSHKDVSIACCGLQLAAELEPTQQLAWKKVIPGRWTAWWLCVCTDPRATPIWRSRVSVESNDATGLFFLLQDTPLCSSESSCNVKMDDGRIAG
jgi:hypothetical protein